ncbi:MAG: hypothetical protein AAF613_09020, partial [Pseudomonadota bacterium]
NIPFLKPLFAILVGGGVLQYANQNYEMLKAENGLIPLICLIGGGGLVFYGVKSFRAEFSKDGEAK